MENNGYNENISRLLGRMFAEKKVPHGLCLVSDEYTDAARRVAASVICENGTFPPCGKCSHCKKALKNIHPDIIECSPLKGKVFIGVDQIRALRSDAYIRPNEAESKVFIINGACSMNEAAQNALLQVLEQPPKNVFFILADNRTNELLSTALSRVSVFRFTSPEKNTVKNEEKAREILNLFYKGDESGLYLKLISYNKREKAIEILSDVSALLFSDIKAELKTGANQQKNIIFFDNIQKALIRLNNAGNLTVTVAELTAKSIGG